MQVTYAQDLEPTPNRIEIDDVETGMFIPQAQEVDEQIVDSGEPMHALPDVLLGDENGEKKDAETENGDEPFEISVSHDNDDFSLPNPIYAIENIRVTGNMHASAAQILRIMNLQNGDDISLDELDRAQFRLALSGLFESVDVELRPGSQSGRLNIEVVVRERSQIQFNHLYIGSSEKSPFWFGLDVSWLAPFDTTHRARMSFAATTSDDYTFSLHYLVPSIAGLPISIAAGIESMVSHEEIFGSRNFLLPKPTFDPATGSHLDDLVFRRDGASLGVGYAPISGLRLLLRFEFMCLKASHDEPIRREVLDHFIKNGTSLMPVVSFGLAWDTRNGRDFPRKGHYLRFNIRGTFESEISDYHFVRASLTHQSNFMVAEGHILRIETDAGVASSDTPFFEKFFYNDYYALASSRIHRLNPSSRGAYDIFKTGASGLSYEDFLVRLALTYAWQPFGGDLEFFATVGGVWADSLRTPELSLGVKPERGRGDFPVDMTFECGVRFRSPYGIFVLTLSQFFDLFARW